MLTSLKVNCHTLSPYLTLRARSTVHVSRWQHWRIVTLVNLQKSHGWSSLAPKHCIWSDAQTYRCLGGKHSWQPAGNSLHYNTSTWYVYTFFWMIHPDISQLWSSILCIPVKSIGDWFSCYILHFFQPWAAQTYRPRFDAARCGRPSELAEPLKKCGKFHHWIW